MDDLTGIVLRFVIFCGLVLCGFVSLVLFVDGMKILILGDIDGLGIMAMGVILLVLWKVICEVELRWK